VHQSYASMRKHVHGFETLLLHSCSSFCCCCSHKRCTSPKLPTMRRGTQPHAPPATHAPAPLVAPQSRPKAALAATAAFEPNCSSRSNSSGSNSTSSSSGSAGSLADAFMALPSSPAGGTTSAAALGPAKGSSGHAHQSHPSPSSSVMLLHSTKRHGTSRMIVSDCESLLLSTPYHLLSRNTALLAPLLLDPLELQSSMGTKRTCCPHAACAGAAQLS
jgi:hypothetical protein